jgi:DNA-binding transcriptional LysR family regulator
MTLDPRRVLTFREVARHRSFSRAAEALALTQPAVSQQVAALERAVGVPLLVRGPGGPTPTAAGELLLDHADVVAERLELAASQLAEFGAAERTRLRIGSFPSALATVVPDAIERLQAAHPGVRVDAVQDTLADLVAATRRGDLHVALVFDEAAGAPRDLGGLRRDELLEEPFVAVVSPGHRLAQRRRVSVADLARETWTAPSRDGLIARAVRATGVEADIAYVTAEPLAAARLVAAGLAVTLTPRLAADMPGVAILEVRDAPRRRIYAVSPARGRHPLVSPLLDALRASVRER